MTKNSIKISLLKYPWLDSGSCAGSISDLSVLGKNVRTINVTANPKAAQIRYVSLQLNRSAIGSTKTEEARLPNETADSWVPMAFPISGSSKRFEISAVATVRWQPAPIAPSTVRMKN